MGTDWKYKRKSLRRKKKAGADRKRREKVHKKRLIALGFKESVAASMNPWKVKDLLKKAARKSTRKLFAWRMAEHNKRA
jgi:hypothetical protein